MTREEVVKKINQILIDEFEIEEAVIDPTGNIIETLGIDSLDLVDLVVLIEKNFGFKVVNEEMGGIKNLNDFYDYVTARAK
ncbi:MAG TPA: phosphopantetheine-binding protein [Spirochaetota bacterium]|nr:phosphopantetheine-binding protein [Spirochaetota bacterium]HPY03580.1 phosphopantetheine-binding protein [Spirochaetota bacterium]HQE59929.1 phosphopantetheine-binding protein [Spirochaetota bacterium]